MVVPYTCADSEKDMDHFFQHEANRDVYSTAWNRVMDHITPDSGGKLTVQCQACWKRYMRLKQINCER